MLQSGLDSEYDFTFTFFVALLTLKTSYALADALGVEPAGLLD